MQQTSSAGSIRRTAFPGTEMQFVLCDACFDQRSSWWLREDLGGQMPTFMGFCRTARVENSWVTFQNGSLLELNLIWVSRKWSHFLFQCEYACTCNSASKLFLIIRAVFPLSRKLLKTEVSILHQAPFEEMYNLLKTLHYSIMHIAMQYSTNAVLYFKAVL